MSTSGRSTFRACLAGLAGAGLLALPVAAQQPLVKRGSCPSGYHASGDYCTPSSKAALPALAREGSCPSGYHVSGDYCLANGAASKNAVPRRGSCPSGYHVSGDYCLQN